LHCLKAARVCPAPGLWPAGPGKLSWTAGPLACGRRGHPVSYPRASSLVAWRADRLPGPPRSKNRRSPRTHRFVGAGRSAGLQPFRPPGVQTVAWRIRGRVIVHAPWVRAGSAPDPGGGGAAGRGPVRLRAGSDRPEMLALYLGMREADFTSRTRRSWWTRYANWRGAMRARSAPASRHGG